MTEQAVECAYRYCDLVFVPQRHNQIYCSSEHTKEETKIRLRESYHRNRDRKSGKKRTCACGTILSRYNETDVCARCEARQRAEHNVKMSEIANLRIGRCLQDGSGQDSGEASS